LQQHQQQVSRKGAAPQNTFEIRIPVESNDRQKSETSNINATQIRPDQSDSSPINAGGGYVREQKAVQKNQDPVKVEVINDQEKNPMTG